MLFFLDVHRGPDHFFDDHGFECAGIEGAAHIAAEAAARIAPARASTHTDPLVFDVRKRERASGAGGHVAGEPNGTSRGLADAVKEAGPSLRGPAQVWEGAGGLPPVRINPTDPEVFLGPPLRRIPINPSSDPRSHRGTWRRRTAFAP